MQRKALPTIAVAPISMEVATISYKENITDKICSRILFVYILVLLMYDFGIF